MTGETTNPGPIPEPGWMPPVAYVGPLRDPDRYALLGSPRSGGEGDVWQADRRTAGARPLKVALKVVRYHNGGPTDSDVDAADAHARVVKEANPPHFVRIHEVMLGAAPHPAGEWDDDNADDRALLVEMEWIEGATLDELATEAPRDQAQLRSRIQWIDELCQAVAAIHSHARTRGNPLVHGDIKPANCVVSDDPDRGLVLVDIGTARLPMDGPDLEGKHTPRFSAPEVVTHPIFIKGLPSDRWSVGAVAYRCFTGEDVPPDAQRDQPVRRTRLVEALESAHCTPKAAEALASHVLDLLHDDPDLRAGDLAEWGTHFVALLQRRTPRTIARPAAVAVVAAAALVLIGGTVAVQALTQHAAVPTSIARITAPATVPASTESTAPSPSASTATPAPTGSGTTAPIVAPTGAVAVPIATPTSVVVPNTTSAPPVVVAAASGAILTPANSAQVNNCPAIAGTANLPSHTTLVLAMRNLDNSSASNAWYVQPVVNYAHASDLGHWRGVVYPNDQSVGPPSQRQEVALMAVSLSAAESAGATATESDDDALAQSGTILDHITIERTKAAGTVDASACPPAG